MMSSEMMSSEAMPAADPEPVFDFTAPKACCVIGIDKTPEAVTPEAPAPTPTPTPTPAPTSHHGHHGLGQARRQAQVAPVAPVTNPYVTQ